MGLALLGALFCLVSMPKPMEKTLERMQWQGDDHPDERLAVQLVTEHTLPGEYVISDLAMIAFRAQRSAPPWLTNLSGMRFRAGGLTESDLFESTEAYDLACVVLWEDKLEEKAPGYTAWARSHYLSIYEEVLEDDSDEEDPRLHQILLAARRGR